MFGYITVNRPELKVKDLELYRSCYCGVCDELCRSYGRRGQILLSYDCTFLAILLTGMLLSMFGMDAVIIRRLYWVELAFFYGVFLIRKCQILSTFCNPFTTFLYLCALELLPTGLLAASAVFL